MKRSMMFTLCLLLVVGLASVALAQGSTPPGATGSPSTQAPGPAAPPSGDTSIKGEVKVDRGDKNSDPSALPRQGGGGGGNRIFGMTPIVAVVAGAALLLVVVLALVAMTRSGNSVTHVDVDRRL
jgi:hypothetical protein